MLVFVLLLFVVATSGQSPVLPECSWACDNPTCEAVCQTKCAPINCTITPAESCPEITGPSCSISCPPVNDTTMCPMCSTECAPLPVACSGSSISCEPTNCGFECYPPTGCPYPTCVLQCASPVCGSPVWGSITTPSFIVVTSILAIATTLL